MSKVKNEEFKNLNIVKSMLTQTINKLEIARNVTIKEIRHLDDEDRKIIENDFETAIHLFHNLKDEFTSQYSYHTLDTFIKEKESEKQELNRAEAKANQTDAILKQMKSEAQEDLVDNEEKARELNIQLGMLKDQYQDEMWEQCVKHRFTSDWLHAQSSQFELHLRQQEQQQQQQIKELETKLEQEHRVHEELEDFYSMKLGEYIQQLVYWIDKYERDKNNYDEKISNLKHDYAIVMHKIAAAKTLYATRQGEIVAYQKIKEKRRLEQIHLAKLNANAIKIQAWWKGIMVRCKLGPYKAKKSRGKGKSKKSSKPPK